jgi:hypothetical protein
MASSWQLLLSKTVQLLLSSLGGKCFNLPFVRPGVKKKTPAWNNSSAAVFTKSLFLQPRRPDALAGLRIATALHEKRRDTRAKRPGCRGVVAPPVKERPFQGRNLHALSDDISEECYMHPVPPDG